jgi:hypothetical protein
MSVRDYQKAGYLPEAILNYLARLGWSHGDAEIFSKEQFVEWFDLASLGRSPAQHNPEKLLWLNHQYIQNANTENLAMATKPFAHQLGIDTEHGPDFVKVVALLKTRANTLIEIAEAAKLFENTFRLINIGLVNEFAQIMHALGIPVRETLDAAATKPYGFMKFSPGVGVGGHCIPIDPLYLAEVAHQVGVSANFIQAASDLNNSMPSYVVSRIKRDHNGSLKGKSVRVIGVSYKPNLADIRETPVEYLVEELEREGAKVSWHDPFISSWRGGTSDSLLPKSADISIIATFHDLFDARTILDSATYTFDCTGKVLEATQL